jgi:DNA-binding transcriptional LysR family regulator
VTPVISPLARFRRAYPNVAIEFVERDRHQLERALQSGQIDLALLIVSNLSKHRLKYQILMQSPRVLWLSSGHHLNRLPEISLQDLRGEAFVQFVSDEAPISARRYLKIRPKVIFPTTSMEAVRGMVATGAAVTILASLVYRLVARWRTCRMADAGRSTSQPRPRDRVEHPEDALRGGTQICRLSESRQHRAPRRLGQGPQEGFAKHPYQFGAINLRAAPVPLQHHAVMGSDVERCRRSRSKIGLEGLAAEPLLHDR